MSGSASRGLPVLFTAHGNPLNALPGTAFGRFLGEWGRSLPERGSWRTRPESFRRLPG